MQSRYTPKLKTKAASVLPPTLFALLVAASQAQAAAPCPAHTASQVRVADQVFRVEVADDEAERARGLSGRESLPAGSGMWFVFPEPGQHAFWMRDMAFAIDLVWIGPDRRVLGALGLTPCGPRDCPLHHPPAPVAFVLEVNAGAFAGKPGDRVEWTCAP